MEAKIDTDSLSTDPHIRSRDAKRKTFSNHLTQCDLEDIKFLLHGTSVFEGATVESITSCLELWKNLDEKLPHDDDFWTLIEDLLFIIKYQLGLKKLCLRSKNDNRFYGHVKTFGFHLKPPSTILPFRVFLYKISRQLDGEALESLAMLTGITCKASSTSALSVLLNLEKRGEICDSDVSCIEEALGLQSLVKYVRKCQDYIQLRKRFPSTIIPPILRNEEKRLCVILNYENIPGKVRKGTEHDVKELTETFKSLGFKVKTKTDMTTMETRECLDALVSKLIDKKFGFLTLFVLSHGDHNENTSRFVTVDKGMLLCEKDVVYRFLREELQHMPKLFFFQCCRDLTRNSCTNNTKKATQPSCDFSQSDAALQNEAKVLSESYSAPHKLFPKNYFIGYSTFPETKSYRNEGMGSLFIQCLCNALKCSRNHDDFLGSVWSKALSEMEKEQEEDPAFRNGNRQFPQNTQHMLYPCYLKEQ